jgi:hypothetical protein
MTFFNSSDFKTYESVQQPGEDPDNQSELFALAESVNYTTNSSQELLNYVFDQNEDIVKNALGQDNVDYLNWINPNLRSEDETKNEIYRNIFLERQDQQNFATRDLRQVYQNKKKYGIKDVSRQTLIDQMLRTNNELRKKYPEIREFEKLPTTLEELEFASEVARESITLQAKDLQQSGMAKTSAEIGGMLKAQIEDPVNIAAIAVPFFGIKAGVSMTKMLWQLGWQGSATVTVTELIQQQDTRKRAEELGLTIDNPALQDYLTNIGIAYEDLTPNKKELNERLLLASIGGLILTPVVGGSMAFLGKLLKGDRIAKDVLTDEINKTIQANKNINKELSESEYKIHVDKIFKKLQQLSKNPETQINNIVPKLQTPIVKTKSTQAKVIDKEINTLLDETEQSLGVKFTDDQKKQISGIIKGNDWNVKRYNQVMKMSNLLDDQKNYKLNFTDGVIQPDDVLKLARESLTYEIPATLAKHLSDVFNGTKDGKRVFRNFFDKKDYLKSLSDPKKDFGQKYKQELLKDYTLLEAVNGLLRNYKLNPNTSFEKLYTDIFEPSFGRQLGFSNDYFGRVHMVQTELVKLFDSKELHKLSPRAKSTEFNNTLRNAIAHVMGETTDDASAKIMGNNLSKMFEYARVQLNQWGADIAKLENYFPQAHDIDKLLKVSNDQWVTNILAKLDVDKTAKNFGILREGEELTLEQVQSKLQKELYIVYDRIINGDMLSKYQTRKFNQNILQKSRHRYLVFKDSKSALSYADEFGKNPYQALADYMDNTAKEIGLLRTFGPNPEENFKILNNIATDLEQLTVGRNIKDKSIFTGKFVKSGSPAQKMFDHVSGKEFAAPSDLARKIKDVSLEFRSIQVVSKLGSAFLASLSDFSYGAMTRKINGMPIHKQIQNYVKNFKTNSQQAREASVVGDMLLDDLRAGARIHGDLMGSGIFSRFSNTLMKISGLENGTLAARKSFRYEFQIHMGRISKLEYNQIDKNTKFMMNRYNITQDDFNKMKTIKLSNDTRDAKVKYLTIANIKDEDLKFKLGRWMATESLAAVPTMTIRARSAMMLGTRAGTAAGEMVRHAMLFKNFPATIMATHLTRTFLGGMRGHSLGTRVQYGVGLALWTTLLGTAIFQLKRIIQGKDPTPLDGKTLFSGFMQGGSGGLIGDLIFFDSYHYGTSRFANFLGPTVATAEDALNLILAPILAPIFAGKDFEKELAKLPANVFNFVERLFPFTNLWYTRLAKERYITDVINSHIDPNYNRKIAARETNERKYGSDYWFRRGSLVPDRSVDFKNAIKPKFFE